MGRANAWRLARLTDEVAGLGTARQGQAWHGETGGVTCRRGQGATGLGMTDEAAESRLEVRDDEAGPGAGGKADAARNAYEQRLGRRGELTRASHGGQHGEAGPGKA